MTVVINGTTGITSPEMALDNGAADGGQVVLKSSGFNNWNIDNYSGNCRFYYNATELMRIDSSGNVGIGASSPAAKLDIAGNILFSAASPQIQFNAGGPIIRLPGANTLAFLSDSSNERMRIDSSGNVGIGTNSPSTYLPTYYKGIAIANSDQTSVIAAYYQGGVGQGTIIRATNTAGTSATNIIFAGGSVEYGRFDGNGNLLVGTTSTIGGSCHAFAGIQVLGQQILTVAKTNQIINQNNNYYVQFNGSNGADGYINTNGSAVLVISDASDRRVKENIVDATYGLNTIQALRPVEYSRIGETQRIKGFIAQEVKEVLPECVTIKDESAYGGLEDMHILEMQTMIPVLVKAMQELNAKVDAQAAEIAALKGQA